MSKAYTIYETKCDECNKTFKSIADSGRCNKCICKESDITGKIEVRISQSPETKAYNKIKNDRNKMKKQIKIECECGSAVSKGNLTAHKKTDKHMKLMKTI